MPRLFSGKVILYFLILLILDLCLAPMLGVLRPIFLYLWVLYVAFYWPPAALVPVAIAAGILRDLTGSLPLGAETISLAAMASAVTFLILKFEREFFLMRLILGIMFVFFGLILSLILSTFLSPNLQLTWNAFTSSFFSSLISIAVMPLFFEITHKWFPQETSSLKQYELFG